MREKNLHRENNLSSEYECCLLPLPVLGQSIFVTVGIFIRSKKIVARSIIVRHMKLILALSLSLRAYCPMMSTHNTLIGVIMTSLVLLHDHTFGCVSCCWQDLQDFIYDRMVLCIPFQYTTDLIVSLRCEWLGCWR
jgi:hypothetical protein